MKAHRIILVLLAVLLTGVTEKRLKPSLRVGAVWLMILLPAALVTGYQFYEFARMNPLPRLVRYESRGNYLLRAEGRGLYRSFLFLKHIAKTGPPMRVRFLGEARAYHCPVAHQAADTNLTALRHLRAEADGDPSRAIALLRDAGYSHVLYNHALFTSFYLSGERHGKSPALAREAQKDAAFFLAMTGAGMNGIYEEAGVAIYELGRPGENERSPTGSMSLPTNQKTTEWTETQHCRLEKILAGFLIRWIIALAVSCFTEGCPEWEMTS